MTGKVWKFHDNVNTDIISPPAYMELSIENAARYTMAPISDIFAKECGMGDIFVAENNLGSGSSRETAPLMLKQCGITAVIAKSFARIFYRNCINVGIVALVCNDTCKISQDDVLSIDFVQGSIRNLTKEAYYPCEKIPPHILELVNQGGLIPYLKTKLKK